MVSVCLNLFQNMRKPLGEHIGREGALYMLKRRAGVGKLETSPGLRARLPRWLGGTS